MAVEMQCKRPIRLSARINEAQAPVRSRRQKLCKAFKAQDSALSYGEVGSGSRCEYDSCRCLVESCAIRQP